MSNLMNTLRSTASVLDAYSQVLSVTQNNVANASTPGYARQSQQLIALRFDPTLGFTGGVHAGAVSSSRNEFAEQSVRQQTSVLGQAQQTVNSLGSLQSLFDVTGGSGISTALNSLYQSFSAWGQTPNGAVARQSVIQRAADVASAFQQAATGLAKVSQDTNLQLQQTVSGINHLSEVLAGYNQQILKGDRNDAGLDAQIHSSLEQLSQNADITATKQTDGSYTVLLNGESPLVIADRTYALRAMPLAPGSTDPYPQGPAGIRLVAGDGRDVTSNTTGGQLGSLLNLANVVLPGYLGDGTHAGDLNTLALRFAKHVNDLLKQGYQTDGANPAPGVPLFAYDLTNDTNVAQSLRVDPAVTPDQLAAIQLGPPEISNGVALALSQLANPTDDTGRIGGLSYTEYYASLASGIGTKLTDAKDQLGAQQSAVVQAQNLRQQLSGVSLDEEATILIQFQRAYEANSKMITILNQLTQTIIDILR